jgi:Tfp pilus assembly pilus retraction ATPase PilT
MAKLDAYLRSIEKFGAAGAVLTSGQPVTLRFPGGDRNATQVTPHDLLVGMVRELAPPAALDTIDQNRPARFDIDSEGRRYTLSVAPRPGMWQVTIEPAAAAPPVVTMREHARPQTPAPIAVADAGEMSIERGQYAETSAATTPPAASASVTLDQLTRGGRSARASDIYLAAGAVPIHRVGGELVQGGAQAMDADAIARELGLVATPEARAAWAETGTGTFAYSDGGGRVRVTLGRDHRGPTAALRLLPEEAPGLDRLNVAKVGDWLNARGLVLVVGAAGAGKTLALAAMVRALADRQKRVVTLEHPIEIRQTAPSISQRGVGEHVPTAVAGVEAALAEGADAIAIGAVASRDAASALVDAVLGGGLVIAAVTAPNPATAVERVLALVAPETRDLARSALGDAMLGALRVSVGRGGARSYEASGRPG